MPPNKEIKCKFLENRVQICENKPSENDPFLSIFAKQCWYVVLQICESDPHEFSSSSFMASFQKIKRHGKCQQKRPNLSLSSCFPHKNQSSSVFLVFACVFCVLACERWQPAGRWCRQCWCGMGRASGTRRTVSLDGPVRDFSLSLSLCLSLRVSVFLSEGVIGNCICNRDLEKEENFRLCAIDCRLTTEIRCDLVGEGTRGSQESRRGVLADLILNPLFFYI